MGNRFDEDGGNVELGPVDAEGVGEADGIDEFVAVFFDPGDFAFLAFEEVASDDSHFVADIGFLLEVNEFHLDIGGE